MTNPGDKAVLQAVGEVIKSERLTTEAKLAEIEKRLEGHLPEFAMASLEARKSAIMKYASDFTLRKSIEVNSGHRSLGVHLKGLG